VAGDQEPHVSKKNKKNKQQARRTQKKAAKRRAREKLVAKRERTGPTKPAPMPGFGDFVSSGEYLRWLAHGANFLASDYEEGTWDPVFPEVYTGDPDNYNQANHDAFRKRLMDRYWNAKTEEWVGAEGKVIVAWATVTPEPAYVFYLEGIRLLADAGVEEPFEVIWAPHNGIIWEFLNQIRARLEAESTRRQRDGVPDPVQRLLDEASASVPPAESEEEGGVVDRDDGSLPEPQVAAQ